MDIAIALVCSTIMLIYVVLKHMFIGYMLIFSFFCFVLVCIYRKYSIKEIFKISWNSAKNSMVVIKVFVLIGGIIGIWFASGTIPAVVYYALGYLAPNIFVLLCFIICSLTSFLIGTSFGTCSVIGVPLMLIATAGHANTAMVAGAIISGAYFGDRISMMSSSAVLVSNVSKSELMINVKNMAKTGLMPTILTILFFWYISQYSVVDIINSKLQMQIGKEFNVSYMLLIPSAIVLIMAIIGGNINNAMTISIIAASILTIFVQGHSILETLKYIVFGFKFEDVSNPLYGIIKGGGIISMMKAAVVVFVSTALTGLLTKLEVTNSIKNFINERNYKRYSMFFATTIVSTIVGMVGCNQSISIILTADIMSSAYEKYFLSKGYDKNNNEQHTNEQIAIDLENSAVPLAGIIPWNIASIVPASTIGVTPFVFIPFAIFLFAVPLCHFIQLYIMDKCVLRRIKKLGT